MAAPSISDDGNAYARCVGFATNITPVFMGLRTEVDDTGQCVCLLFRMLCPTIAPLSLTLFRTMLWIVALSYSRSVGQSSNGHCGLPLFAGGSPAVDGATTPRTQSCCADADGASLLIINVVTEPSGG